MANNQAAVSGDTPLIRTVGLRKVYRTEEVETTALVNVNVEIPGGSSWPSWGPPAAAGRRC